ncbi:MAG TPA: helix-turn-helix domain-containing protein, partial [Candidatus Thermoplasmatota archaeon]|nr:helix-turn-helix domain-containing protein [Candidatus Thermoplasmatota archaeon]
PCTGAEEGCQIGDLFRILGKAHMLDILAMFIHENQGPLRFVDIQNRLGLSPNTLSERLKELVEAGLLTRTAYNEIPPRVDYDATTKAHELEPVFHTLAEWARRHTLKAQAEPDKATA